jgi:hypothetical protein
MEPAVAEQPAVVDRRDKFSLSYFVWVTLLFLLFASSNDLDRIFNLYLVLVPLLVLSALSITICWTATLLHNLWLRRWRRVVSVLAAPVAAYALFAAANAAGVTPQWVRFELGRRYYTDEIAKLAKTDEARFKTFDWGRTSGDGVANIIYTLVYDESDEILLPQTQRSKAGQERARKRCPGTIMCSLLTPPSEGSPTAIRIEGHFFLVTEAF